MRPSTEDDHTPPAGGGERALGDATRCGIDNDPVDIGCAGLACIVVVRSSAAHAE